MHSPLLRSATVVALATLGALAGPPAAMRFQARDIQGARAWQQDVRGQLTALMMGGKRPEAVPFRPMVLRSIDISGGGYVVEEITLQSLPDRLVHAWLARPAGGTSRRGAVLALHGHGGTGEEVVSGRGLYWYGRALAEMGYVVIAPDIGQHDRQHPDWSLMGERVWDALCCVDYLAARPDVDPDRIAVAGLSLGGETAMYVAALDERVRVTDSSGWLTTVANMKQGHCPCWSFPGLEANFDFADIFACIAPRPLVCELGEKERAPGGFPVETGRRAFAEIQAAYRVFGASANAKLTVHPGGHVFVGQDFWPCVRGELGHAYPWQPFEARSLEELLRRGEIGRRSFCRALGVFTGWWKLRDPVTGLFPRRLDQPVWAPNDNAADMLPFLALTCYHLAPQRLDEVLRVIPIEQRLTTRWHGLPDWFGLTNRAFVHPTIDTNRLIFCAAEYCKDGLLPMTEVMGRGLWTDRMFGLVDAVFANAPYRSDFGDLPAQDTEVNGELLQVLSRLYCMTRDARFLRWAQRIGDAYCFEVLPRSGFMPAYRWDFVEHKAIVDEFSLNDHGNEIVGGLSELYVACRLGAPEKAARYRPSLDAMARRLIERGRNADGLWVERLQASTGRVLDPATPDTWGYALCGVATLGGANGKGYGGKTARMALRHLTQDRYLTWDGADSYADSIEGGLILLNRFPEPAGFAWLERVLPIFLGKQRDDGVVEGWYGDGNYARTALMAGLYFTQGVRCIPWNDKIRFGAVRCGQDLQLGAQSDEDWEGRFVLDRPRHRLHLNLPIDYPRLNEFPEWFTVEDDAEYAVAIDGRKPVIVTGAKLNEGIFLELKAGQALRLCVSERRGPPSRRTLR